MRIFIQFDDPNIPHPNVLEPLFLDLIAMGTAVNAPIDQERNIVYLVSVLPKPTENLTAEWIHPTKATQLINEPSAACILVHFGPAAPWAKGLPSYFIPLGSHVKKRSFGLIASWMHKKRIQHTMQQAKQVVALDEWHAQNNAGAQRVYLEKAPLPNFEWSALAPIRSALTDGNQYLLAFVDTADIITIVKAFSVFKKWQLSTMSLVFVLDTEEDRQKASTLLLGYKYRDAVELVNLATFKLEWIAASYLTIFSQMNSHRFQFLTYAMRYQLPFLLHQDPLTPAFILPALSAAGEYFNFNEPDTLANHFKLYYKDEMYRAAKGLEVEKAIQSEMKRFQETATLVWPRDLS